MEKKRYLKSLILLSAGILLYSCGGENNNYKDVVVTDTIANAELNTAQVSTSEKNEDLYKTLVVNDQTWMAENLNVSVFLNGDSIPEAKTPRQWLDAFKNEQAAWCYYENKLDTLSKEGKLYNWFAINDKRGLAPKGWRIPTQADFEQLVKNLGGEKIAGAKLKSNNVWSDPERNTNESGFSALPSGMRKFNGAFSNKTDYCYFWSIADRPADNAWYFGLNNKNSIAKTFFSQKGNGFSVRCMKIDK